MSVKCHPFLCGLNWQTEAKFVELWDQYTPHGQFGLVHYYFSCLGQAEEHAWKPHKKGIWDKPIRQQTGKPHYHKVCCIMGFVALRIIALCAWFVALLSWSPYGIYRLMGFVALWSWSPYGVCCLMELVSLWGFSALWVLSLIMGFVAVSCPPQPQNGDIGYNILRVKSLSRWCPALRQTLQYSTSSTVYS